MKKTLSILLIAVLLILPVGCAKQSPSPSPLSMATATTAPMSTGTPETIVTASPAPSPSNAIQGGIPFSQLSFPYKVPGIDYYSYDRKINAPFCVLTSHTEAKNYLLQMCQQEELTGWEVNAEGDSGQVFIMMDEALNSYSFQTNCLVAVHFFTPSGGDRFRVDSVKIDEKQLTIFAVQTVQGITDDIGYWNFFLELPANGAMTLKTVRVEII